MINHARTLLLNKTGKTRPAIGVDGEEYVSPQFFSLSLLDHLEAVHVALFGRNPDVSYENLVLCQCMTALHVTDQARDFILGLDPRVTYHLPPDTITSSGVTVERLMGDATLTITGTPEADHDAGLASFFYRVTYDGVEMRVQDMLTGVVTVTAGNAVTKHGVRMSASDDGIWLVKLSCGDVRLNDIVARLEDRKRDIAPLWREARDEFYTWWLRGQTPVIRLAGLLCAQVEVMDRIWNGQR